MSETTNGTFNFLSEATEPSLWRNSQVLMVRDTDGNTAESKGVDLASHVLDVVDARHQASPMTCERNGFELLAAPLEMTVDFMDHTSVIENYYPHCEALVSKLTGARAYAFDHNIRSAGGKEAKRRITGGQDVQDPAHVVHGDYTLRSGPDRLLQLTLPPGGNDTLKGILAADESLISEADANKALNDGRFAIINVWRNIDDQPVATHPLALCDGQTVAPEDLVVFEIHYADRIGENYFAKFSPSHKFYYYPSVTRDEALIIKQWDSAGPLATSNGEAADAVDPDAPCTFSFHSAFVEEDTPADAPDRWSIEVRCIVVY